MPYLQHPELGNALHFARSDHSIPIPRPAFDSSLGIENACQKCHAAMSIDSLESKAKMWYGEMKPHKSIIAGVVKAKTLWDRKTAAELVLLPDAKHPMAQFAGIAHMVERYLSPDMSKLEDEIVDRLKRLARSDDIDVQSLALAVLHFARGEEPEIHSFLTNKLRQLGERENLVRKRWALALGYLADSYRNDGQYQKAIVTYKKALEITPQVHAFF